MPTLVVASEEEEGGRVVDLQGPQIEHTLQMQTEKQNHQNEPHIIAILSYDNPFNYNCIDISIHTFFVYVHNFLQLKQWKSRSLKLWNSYFLMWSEPFLSRQTRHPGDWVSLAFGAISIAIQLWKRDESHSSVSNCDTSIKTYFINKGSCPKHQYGPREIEIQGRINIIIGHQPFV